MSISFKRTLAILAVPLILLLLSICLIKSPNLLDKNGMSLALSIDLLLTIPLVYFLLIRKTKIPKTTVVAFVIIGLVIGSTIMPKENQSYLNLFKTWVLPLLELSILTYVIITIRKTRKKFKALQGSSPDFFQTLLSAISDILPQPLVRPFATEIAVFYYGFLHWKTPNLRENEFTYHRNSASQALMFAFLLVIAIETIALHLLLIQWSVVAAWILTCLSIYSGFQVFGFARSLSKRPITVNSNSISLRYGILSEVEIPIGNVASIKAYTAEIDKDSGIKTLSPLGELESHNLRIDLKKEMNLIGVYGIKKSFKSLVLHIDEPQTFLEFINLQIKSSK